MSKETTNNETRRHIMLVSEHIGKVIKNLISRQENHDKSKLDTPEVEILDEYTPKLLASTYGNAEYYDLLKSMKSMLYNHYKINRHHPEYHSNGIQGMTLIDLIEMLCDWRAACQRHHNGNLIKSLDINQERYKYSDELKQILSNTLKEMEG